MTIERPALPELTVVIPAYRCALYLPAAVASAVADGPARVLICEDAGGDDTPAVARTCAALYPAGLVEVVENPSNLGMTRNWQQALSRVTTELAIKLDADDLLFPGYAAAAVAHLRARGDVAMAAATTVEFADGRDEPDVSRRWDDPTGESFASMSGAEACRYALRWAPYAASSTVAYRMSAWREVGGFDVRLNWCPDREIWFRMARLYPVSLSPRPAIHYRLHAGSVSTATARADRNAAELEHMLRVGVRLWPERSLRGDFRRARAVVTRAHLGTARRAAARGRWAAAARGVGRAVCSLGRQIVGR